MKVLILLFVVCVVSISAQSLAASLHPGDCLCSSCGMESACMRYNSTMHYCRCISDGSPVTKGYTCPRAITLRKPVPIPVRVEDITIISGLNAQTEQGLSEHVKVTLYRGPCSSTSCLMDAACMPYNATMHYCRCVSNGMPVTEGHPCPRTSVQINPTPILIRGQQNQGILPTSNSEDKVQASLHPGLCSPSSCSREAGCMQYNRTAHYCRCVSHGLPIYEGYVCPRATLRVTRTAQLNQVDLSGPKHGKIVVCYVASWAAYRVEDGKFVLEDLEPALCTHLVYSFAGLNEMTNVIKSLDPWQDLEVDYGKAGYKRIVGLKDRYPHLKVTLAIGGWNEGSPKYSNMASSPESRATFIKSVLLMLNNYKFDGLDLDWEYPTKREGKPEDRENFVLLVKELKEAFEPYGYILTAALGAGKTTMDTAYDLTKLSRYLDLIHMMCYDYHGTWDRKLGANAPLKGTTPDDVLSVEYTVNYMLSHGVSPYKLVMGLPMYGRTFILTDPDTKVLEFGSTPVKEAGFKGPYTGEAGFMGYNEICVEAANMSSPWVYHWHDQSSTAYLRDGERVIAYDDGRAIATKVQYAIERGLGGVMVWSIDTDDFKGHCNESNAYVDFVNRHKRMVDDPLVKKAAKNLNLPDINTFSSKGPSYVLQNDELHLRLPQPRFTNYALMQTINDAISLSLEEKRIQDEVKRIQSENEVIVDDKKSDKGSSSNIGSSLLSVLACLVVLLKF